MQSHLEELEERMRRGISLLAELSGEGVAIVVEGVRDVAALRRLGLQGPLYTLAGNSVVSLADRLSCHDRVLVLFDFDLRGERLAAQLTEHLQGQGTTVLQWARRHLARAFSWRTRVIEGLKPLPDLRDTG